MPSNKNMLLTLRVIIFLDKFDMKITTNNCHNRIICKFRLPIMPYSKIIIMITLYN